MVPECPREHDVAALVRAERWPSAGEPNLVAHVAACEACREVVAVATLVLEVDRGIDVHVPSAPQMWWRLAVRARLEREQAAARPVVWLQGLAGACGAGIALTLLGRLGPALSGSMSAVVDRVMSMIPAAVPMLPLTSPAPALLAIGGLVLVALASAVYLWLVEE